MKIPRLAAAAFVLLTAGGLSRARAEAGAVATVDGENVSAAEFEKDWNAFLDIQRKALKPEQMTPEWERSRKRMLLDKIIEQRLLLQAAKKLKVEVKPQEIDQAAARVKARFKVDAQGRPVSAEAADAAFKKELAAENVTEAQFRENIANQLRGVALTDRIVKERVKPPTAEQLRATFDAVKDRMLHPAAAPAGDRREEEIEAMAQDMRLKTAERVQLQHIRFRVDPGSTAEHQDSVLMQAKQVKAKIDKGADFGDMARQYSDDAASGKNGGEGGFVARGELRDAALDEAIFALPVGGVSDVLKTPGGYEIVRVEEKRAASDLRFDGARKYIQDNLLRFAAQDVWKSYVADLWKAAVVERKAGFADSLPAQ